MSRPQTPARVSICLHRLGACTSQPLPPTPYPDVPPAAQPQAFALSVLPSPHLGAAHALNVSRFTSTPTSAPIHLHTRAERPRRILPSRDQLRKPWLAAASVLLLCFARSSRPFASCYFRPPPFPKLQHPCRWAWARMGLRPPGAATQSTRNNPHQSSVNPLLARRTTSSRSPPTSRHSPIPPHTGVGDREALFFAAL